MRIVAREKCNVCGAETEFKIDDNATLLREAVCSFCGSSIRVSDIAGIIQKEMSIEKKQMQNRVNENLCILNLCSQGKVHELYKTFSGYRCGEYFDGVASGAYLDGIMCIDLQDIPFEDNYFDFIITEDVLEHVWDITRALNEINRVLKPGGKHIFTVPVHENIVTMSRKNNQLEVFHGDPLRPEGAKVFTDFGRDIVSFIDKFGMKTTMHTLHKFHEPDETSFIDDEAESYKKNWRNMLGVFRYNSIVLVSEKVVDCNMDKKKQKFEKEEYTLPFTGERFVPDMSEKYIVAEHYQRYNAVLNIVKGKKVLDAACGAGYGTALMASVAEEVTGIDISSEAISFANHRYSDISNAKYLEASIAELPFSDNTFDVIVSFETIEHVNEDLQNKFLKEIKRCLKDDGILVMSSPDKRTYSDLPGFNNEFHVKEFYFDEFDAFLHREFKYVEHYLQGECNLSGEFIRKKNSEIKIFNLLNEISIDSNEEKYIVSVCTNVERVIQDISSFYAFTEKYVPLIYVYTNGTYSADQFILPNMISTDNDTYKVRFDLSNQVAEGKIRFDPVENVCCGMEILSIKTDVIDYQVLPLNAISHIGNKYTFITLDPIVEIRGDFTDATYIDIEYSLKIFNSMKIAEMANKEISLANEKISKEANLLSKYMAEIDLVESKCSNLLCELNQIKNTKGYRILEKIRRLREKGKKFFNVICNCKYSF